MKAVSKLLVLCMIPLLLSACLHNAESNHPTINSELSPPVEISLEEAEARTPFEIQQPSVPFQVTQKSARILDTNGKFDAVEITYANPDEGLNLIIMITNSQVDTPPNGKKGLKLSNGSQTWDQGDGHVSAVYWRNEGLTYSLVSGKNNNLEPLYDYQTLIEIANTII
ncbi:MULTISPECIES: hypothetical protein [unclassified Paenibacillus]|uniref:hypothetical protein n=1 Tax=unclassified Paenibacillus TaxID=185978 RepID=UPI0008CD1BDD|nr:MULTISPECIES: hypothetical protein [unclassified Paenibacillus]QLG40198.1 hypothetical protein HW560_20185 [Paenibacillus sp. E222]SEN80554.1 hypothetical protein SAMN05518670_2761 [Paenibacillus sp. OK076]